MATELTKESSLPRIPELRCDPDYSMRRIPTTLPGGLDTTQLTKFYGFVPEDLGLKWGFEVNTVSGGGPQTDDKCDAGNQVDDDDDLFVRITPPTYPDNTLREITSWISSPLPCNSASSAGGIALQGPVNFTNRRSNSFSMPTFVPRAGGGRKDSSTPEPLQLGIYRGIDPETGKHLVELVSVECDGGLVYTGETVTAAGWDNV